MTVEQFPEIIEKLESSFINILFLKPEERVIRPNAMTLNSIKDILNTIFDENQCVDAIYTHNTDKQLFGVRVDPQMSAYDSTVIISSDEKMKLKRYSVELDSRLFDIDLDESELAAIVIYEIDNTVNNCELFDRVRSIIDYESISNDTIINIRDSINYGQLLIFALKDTIYKLSSMLFKDKEDLAASTIIQTANLTDSLISAKEKISVALGESSRSPKPVIVAWMLVMLKNMKINSGVIRDTLTDAKAFTGSKLEVKEIDNALDSIDKINNTLFLGESTEQWEDLNAFFDRKNLSKLNEISIFKSLKKNGLRGIENDLYEYTMRVRNCREADDAYLVMRAINNRLGILEDYLYQEQLSPAEAEHWEEVANRYRDLRTELAKKKFNEKQYGLFFDYSKLDNM